MSAVAADGFDDPRAGMGANGQGDGLVGGGDDIVPVASLVQLRHRVPSLDQLLSYLVEGRVALGQRRSRTRQLHLRTFVRGDGRVERRLHLRAHNTDRLFESCRGLGVQPLRVLSELPLGRHAHLLGERLRCLAEDAHLRLQALHAFLALAKRLRAHAIRHRVRDCLTHQACIESARLVLRFGEGRKSPREGLKDASRTPRERFLERQGLRW